MYIRSQNQISSVPKNTLRKRAKFKIKMKTFPHGNFENVFKMHIEMNAYRKTVYD